MAHLSRSDLEAALAFAAELGTAAAQRDRADVWFLERISQMIGLDLASYSHHSETTRYLLADAEYPANPAAGPWEPSDHEWDVIKAENPYCVYVDRTGDRYFSARRLTDVTDISTYRHTEHAEMIGFEELPHSLLTRLPGEGATHWTLEVVRAGRNYSKRDILMLDALRPALTEYEAYRRLAATVADLRAERPGVADDSELTTRESEILDHVAAGATNAAIAERLWISPGTVKKHLEHIYTKLEVGSRTAALARTGRSLSASSSVPDSRGSS